MQRVAAIVCRPWSSSYLCAMKKIYCLATCDTCRTIIKDIDAVQKGFELQDIKTQSITPAQLDELKTLAGSYEALFSRRAIKYKTMKLKDAVLTEADYRRLILEEYTFLKRPVIIDGKKIFVGSEKKTVEALAAVYHK
jgi:arsenate reductase